MGGYKDRDEDVPEWKDIWPRLTLRERADMKDKLTDREWAWLGKKALKKWLFFFVLGVVVGVLLKGSWTGALWVGFYLGEQVTWEED